MMIDMGCSAAYSQLLLLLLQAIESEGMLGNAQQRGVQLMKGLVKLADK